MNKKNREALNYLNTLIKYADSKLSQINNKINDSNDLKLHTILQLGIVINHYVENIKNVLESYNILAGNVLLRSLIEGFISIEYIIQDDKQLRSIAYFFQDYKTREKNIKTCKEGIIKVTDKSKISSDLSTPKKCDEYLLKLEEEKRLLINNLKENFNIEVNDGDLNFLNIFDRAESTNLRNLYKILYPHLSGISHMDASGLKYLISFESGKYSFIKRDNEIEINHILVTTSRIYLVLIEDLFKEFNLYIEEDFKKFEKYLGQDFINNKNKYKN